MKMFMHAFGGIWHAIKTERNIRFHLAAVFYVVIAGIFFEFVMQEWVAAILACGLVVGAELFNTAIERLCDVVEPDRSRAIKAVKDLASGAVLICAVTALVIAVVLLWLNIPYWLEWQSLADLIADPGDYIEFWIGVGALPFWGAFIFWFGKKGK